MFSIDISKVPFFKTVTVVTVIFCMIMGPFWLLFQFQRELFNDPNFFRFLLICAACGWPTIIIHIVIQALTDSERSTGSLDHFIGVVAPPKTELNKEEIVHDQTMTASKIFSASLNSLAFFYFPCVLTFWWNFSLKTAIYIVAVLHLLFIIVRVLKIRLNRMSKNPQGLPERNTRKQFEVID